MTVFRIGPKTRPCFEVWNFFPPRRMVPLNEKNFRRISAPSIERCFEGLKIRTCKNWHYFISLLRNMNFLLQLTTTTQ